MNSCTRSRLAFALCLAVARATTGATAPSTLQQLADTIGPPSARQAIGGVAARAEATGPRGAFVSEMLSLADGSARFRLTKNGESTELLVAGTTPYERSAAANGGRFAPADPALASFVRGHEVHRMLLDLERRFRPAQGPVPPGCLALRGPDGLPATLCRGADSELPASIALELPAAAGGGSVTLELADWRSLPAAPQVQLPFAVDFLHGSERHAYRYTAVLPFRLAPGVSLPEAPDTLFARLDDLAALAAAHERALEAHRRSDVRMLLADAGERTTSSGRGVLKELGREELAARLGPYLESTRFSRYEDVATPVIALSADGSLGWLACQIEAAGLQQPANGPAESIAFGFSWIELYAQQDGAWRSIGNASSARP